MAFILICGNHTFSGLLKGYEHLTVQCQRCGNYSAKLLKRWEWFTVCFIPVIPFSLKPWHDVSCHICNFHQDVRQRPDVQAQMNGQSGGHVPMQPYNQGWNGQQPPQAHIQQGPQQQYQQSSGQQPQYK